MSETPPAQVPTRGRGGGRGGRGGRGGSRGGRGGGGGGNNEDRTISKALSLTLRHAAEKEGLKLRSDGYANAAELVSCERSSRSILRYGERAERTELN